jgi:hypothetical protein
MQRLWMSLAPRTTLLPGILAALVLACGSAVPAGDDTTADAKVDAAQDAKDIASKADAQDAADQVGSDAVDAVDAVDVADGVTGGDADTSSDNCTAEPGAPGCTCQDNSTCDLPICLPTAQGAKCAKPCIENCPAGFKCFGVAGPGGGDPVSVCVDQFPHLCDPCANSTQCGAVGLQAAACVDSGKDGHFCGAACKSDGDCPGGYGCANVKSVEGNDVQQCQPTAGATCTCSPSAVADQLSTSCFAEAKDEGGNVVGQCKGVRVCGVGGLSGCNASIQTETCNGQDDDCDGLVDEGTCDDKNPCTSDICDAKAQGCLHDNSPGSCDADANNCTVGDTCVDGKCAIGALKSCDDNNPCTTDACDPLTGCSKSDDNGLPCSDGSACTVGDACKGGACQSGAAKLCPDGDACKAWACNDTSGKCESTAKPDGTSCSDGTACTAADVCTSGACAGKPVDCDDKNPCTLDTCDPSLQCQHTAANTPCDDSNACTTGDTCAAKKCAGTPINISLECGDFNPCTTDTCDKIAGCVYLANTAPCSDGNSCTAGDVCANKACSAGTTIICGCQTDIDCVDDGNLCNGTLYCAANQCKVNPASVKTCDTSGDGPCSQTACEPSTGACTSSILANGKVCDADGTVCTGNDSCQNGACIAGSVKSCNDNNPCTDDSCDSVSGCLNAANVSPCDADGNACTVGDMCSGKYCLVGAKKNCDDGVDCTADACDQSSGQCNNDPTPMNNQSCDADGSVCTQGDKCVSGSCKAGAAVNCDDGIACTADLCDPAGGCKSTNMADGAACGAVGYKCVSLQCVKCGNNLVEAGEQCDDGNVIAGDGCSAACQWDLPQLPKPGELIITEVMAEPTSVEYRDEWVEIYNASDKPLLIQGLFFGDDAAFIALMQDTPWTLYPGKYAVIAALGLVGGYKSTIVPDFTYGYDQGGIQFSNSKADYACISTDEQCATGVIAKMKYAANSQPSGASMQLKLGKFQTVFATGTTNYGSTNWCTGNTLISGGEGNYGTPGKPDPNCP